MSTEIPVDLAVNPNAAANSQLARAMDAIWKGQVHLPSGVRVKASTPSSLTVRFTKHAFTLEFDTVAVLTFLHLKLGKKFLIPPSSVRYLDVTRTESSLALIAICSTTKTVSHKEAKRLISKPSLPPGIHNHAALFVTEDVKPHTVKGGLPSLGKRK
ncbi:MAG: hypothetical protein Q8L63_01725 [Alphaproteobacteria bacterium]|nr:hypothetical protein [Alphaproteobacteria bacterium]